MKDVAAVGQARNSLVPTSHMGFITHLPEALRVMREFIDGQRSTI
jgi:hypothetical protein